MWQTKTFKTLEKKKAWMERNEHKMQIEHILVNNAYGVLYKPLRIINIR